MYVPLSGVALAASGGTGAGASGTVNLQIDTAICNATISAGHVEQTSTYYLPFVCAGHAPGKVNAFRICAGAGSLSKGVVRVWKRKRAI
jgi:hypothetical protein